MANFTGFYNLANSKDLFKKLEWEFEQLINSKEAMEYRFHAFNFFVTAFHIADWPDPANGRPQHALKATETLKICGHIANGAKHFTTYPHVKSVRSLDEMKYVDDGYVEFGYFETLYITVDQDELPESPGTIGVCEFAKKVVDFWRERLMGAGGKL